MPYCEECNYDFRPEELFEDVETKSILCGPCSEDKTLVKLPPKENTLLGRTFDYEVSLTKKGLSARGRVGGMKASIQIDNDELAKAFGPLGR